MEELASITSWVFFLRSLCLVVLWWNLARLSICCFRFVFRIFIESSLVSLSWLYLHVLSFCLAGPNFSKRRLLNCVEKCSVLCRSKWKTTSLLETSN